MKTKLIPSLLILPLLVLFSCACKKTGKADAAGDRAIVNHIDAERFREMLADTTVQLIDVRTAEEYAAGHIGNARLLPVTDNDFRERAERELDKHKPLLIYCRSGGRSAKAADILLRQGYFVFNLKGGYKGYPYK